jgi:hypothetical protein
MARLPGVGFRGWLRLPFADLGAAERYIGQRLASKSNLARVPSPAIAREAECFDDEAFFASSMAQTPSGRPRDRSVQEIGLAT